MQVYVTSLSLSLSHTHTTCPAITADTYPRTPLKTAKPESGQVGGCSSSSMVSVRPDSVIVTPRGVDKVFPFLPNGECNDDPKTLLFRIPLPSLLLPNVSCEKRHLLPLRQVPCTKNLHVFMELASLLLDCHALLSYNDV